MCPRTQHILLISAERRATCSCQRRTDACRRQRPTDNALVAAERGEGIASLGQPLEQMFAAAAHAAADAFNQINSPNENSSKEVY